MSSFKHSKKRNTGLLQEWFARFVARAILENNDSDLAAAKKILATAFRVGTELHKEAACFEIVYQGRGKFASKEAAAMLVERVRKACKNQNQEKLDQEKNALISQVRQLKEGAGFFDQQVPDYKTHVMIQVLLNHWRAVETGNTLLEIRMLSDVTQLEDQLITYLSTSSGTRVEKEGRDAAASQRAMEMTPDQVDKLVIKLMATKVDKKFSGLLPEQKRLVNAWVFRDSERQDLVSQLVKIRNSTIGLIEWAKQNEEGVLGKGLVEKLSQVRSVLSEKYSVERLQDPGTLSEDEIAFFMEVCDLRSELLGSGRQTVGVV